MRDYKTIADYYAEMEDMEIESAVEGLKRISKKRFDEYKKSKRIIDLHSHTCYSDGELEPIELLNLAVDKTIATLAITDHDTLDGIKDARENHSDFIEESGIELINGIELSAQVSKGIMHILGYGIDIYNKELNDKIVELKNNSIYSMLSYLNDLKNRYGIRFTTEDIQDLFNVKGNLGRPHLAKLLIKYGYASSFQDAFDKYLLDVYENVRSLNKKPSYEECISLIKNAGGYAVLAHPYSLKQDNIELLKTIRDMITCGLDGIEVYHSNHSLEQMSQYMQIALDNNLVYSVGSDFHGKGTKPDIELGSGKDNNLNINYVTLVKKISKH